MFGYCHGSPKDNDGVHTLSLMLVQPSKFGNVVNHDIFVLTFWAKYAVGPTFLLFAKEFHF